MSNGDPVLWLTRTQAAELVGLSARQFDEALRPRLDEQAIKGAGKTLRFHGPAVVAALVKYRLEQHKPAPPLSEDEALLLGGGGDSPQLERFRKLKSDMLERDLAERDLWLVERRVLTEGLRPAVTAMRAASERLTKRFGNDAGDIYNEAVDDLDAALSLVIERFANADDQSGGRASARAGPDGDAANQAASHAQ